jgi:hypothetical protein
MLAALPSPKEQLDPLAPHSAQSSILVTEKYLLRRREAAGWGGSQWSVI